MRTAVISFVPAIVLLGTVASAQWVQTAGPPLSDVSTIVVCGTKVFAGTGIGVLANGRVFLTTNDGENWSEADSGMGPPTHQFLHVTCFAQTPMRDGPGKTNLFAGTMNGVFLSTNDGMKWISVYPTSGYKDATALAVTSASEGTNGTTLWVGGSCSAGVFRSTDDGKGWTPAGLTNAGILSFAVSPASTPSGGTTIFAGGGAPG